MKKSIFFLSCFILVSSIFSQEKLAQTSFKFLSLSLEPRISAMGGASVAVDGNSTGLFYNPASMANIDAIANVAAGQLNWIADFKYQYFTASFAPEFGRYGVFAISYMNADYGTFQATTRGSGFQGFLDVGEYSPTAYVIGIGYARALSDKFSVGGQIKYAYQNLTGGAVNFTDNGAFDLKEYDLDVLVYDFGLIYKTGLKSFNLGMYIRNFSEEIKYIKESFQLPLTFELGVSANISDFIDLNPEQHSLLMAVDVSHPRDYSETLNLGLEYGFMNTFFLRTGIVTPSDEEGISLGAGFAQSLSGFSLTLDYSYTEFGVFGDVQRFGLTLSY